jgi:multiple sugar transport system substrate-binding protein
VPTQAAWFEKVVADWNAANDVKIKLQYVPNDQYMNGSKLQTAFASGEGPDLFVISAGDFLRYSNAGILLDLSPYVEPSVQADFPPAVLAPRLVDGKLYAIPYEIEPMAMYYSVKAFEDAKLNENDVPKTWDELLELGKRLTNSNRYGLLFDTTPGYYQNFTWYPFLWEAGGDIVGSDGKTRFDTPATVAALKFWQDSIKSGAAPRKTMGGGAWDSVPNLGSGYCAMQNCGIWAISQLRSGAKDFRYGVFALPTPPGGHYETIAGGWAFVANARGQDPQTAGRFCAWALASKAPGSTQRIVDWCTVAKSDMPPRNSAFKVGASAFDQGMLKVFRDEVYVHARAEPRVPPQVYKSVSDAIQACQLGGADPARQASLAAREIGAFLDTYRGARII